MVVKRACPSFAGSSHERDRATSGAGGLRSGFVARCTDQIEGSRAVDEIDAITHRIPNTIPIMLNANTTHSHPLMAQSPRAFHVSGKELRKT